MESCEAEKLFARLSRKKMYDTTHTADAPALLLMGVVIFTYFFTMKANLSFNLKNHFS